MSNRFHNKFHRHNHHTQPTDREGQYPDSAYDPIASPNSPFRGEFYVDGNITTLSSVSALGDLFASNGTFHEDVIIEGNLSVLGSTTQLDTFVYVTSALDITNVGTGPALKVTQSGNQPIAHFIDSNGDDIIFADNGYVGLGTDTPNEKLTVVGNISATGNTITNGNSYLSGSSFIVNDLTVDTDTLFVDSINNRVGIGTIIPSAVLHISGNDGLVIPVGTTLQRVNVQGAIRYNKQDQVFEGYDGANWGSLGGVKDVNQDTYITAEDFPGANNDELKFFTFGTERMRILSGGKVGINIAQPVTTLHVSGSDAITIPFGDTFQRPSSTNVPLTGAIRLNTDLKDFEGFNGTNWRLLGDFTYTKNLTVSIDPTKSFGRYRNTDIIPSFGKTVSQVLEMSLVEPILPSVFLSSSSSVLFNQTSISNILTFSHFISSLGATVDTATLEYKRNLADAWTTISSLTIQSGSFTHSFSDPLLFSGATNAAGSNVIPFYYRYIVTDTIGAMASASISITPQTYSAPSTNTPSVGSVARYKGDINTTYAATLTRNRLYIPIASYQLQRSMDGGAWSNIGLLVPVTGDPATISISISDNNDSAVRNANTIQYRLAYTDSYVASQSTAINSNTSTTITFVHRNALIFNSNTAIAITDIDAASIVGSTSPGAILSSSKTRTVNGVTALPGQYTYYAYAVSAGNLTAVIQDGALPVLTAFGSPLDLTGTNANGATVNYRIYRSNSTQAFTSATLAFS